MEKSSEAFRTISEIAEWLDTPAYVLRFWESKFRHIRPVKRSGNRRYYRPRDAYLVAGIKKLLHIDGHTIKEVQLLLIKEGVKYVSAIGKNHYRPLGSQAESTGEAENIPSTKEHIKTKAKAKTHKQVPSNNGKLPDKNVPQSEISAPALPIYDTQYPRQEKPIKTRPPTAKSDPEKTSEVVAIKISSKDAMPEQLDMFSLMGPSHFGEQRKIFFEQEPKIDLTPPPSFLQPHAQTSPNRPLTDNTSDTSEISAALNKLRALRERFANRLE